MKAVVVGARCARQGVGEYTARWLAAEGVEVAAVVGTRAETVALAQENLRVRYGLEARGSTSLHEALTVERPELVAIGSPHACHPEHLREVAELGAHCLCEKPLWWDEEVLPAPDEAAGQTHELLEPFSRQARLLDLVTQWPCTLPAFEALHGALERGDHGLARIQHFAMLLSPTRLGPAMVPDAAPHVLSMLEALVGPGDVLAAVARYPEAGGREVRLEFRYRHATGEVQVEGRFVTTEHRPRPAAYAVDGRWVERHIQLPSYQISFRADGREVEVEDPLRQLVRRFLERLSAGETVDVERLGTGMRNLALLARAAAEGKT